MKYKTRLCNAEFDRNSKVESDILYSLLEGCIRLRRSWRLEASHTFQGMQYQCHPRQGNETTNCRTAFCNAQAMVSEFIDFVSSAAGGVAKTSTDLSTALIGVASRLEYSIGRYRERKMPPPKSSQQLGAAKVWMCSRVVDVDMRELRALKPRACYEDALRYLDCIPICHLPLASCSEL